jgi:hypothetical protein
MGWRPGKARPRSATSEMARIKTETLGTEENFKPPTDLSGKWID